MQWSVASDQWPVKRIINFTSHKTLDTSHWDYLVFGLFPKTEIVNDQAGCYDLYLIFAMCVYE